MEIIGLVFLTMLIVWMITNRPRKFDREWRHVPPPNWACKKGWHDIW